MERKEYKHEDLAGTDINIDISLKEYGIAWIESESSTLFYYGVDHNGSEFDRFDFCSIDNDTDIKSDFNWADFPSIQFCVGLSDAEWETLPLTSKIGDMLAYYGFENIFGATCYEGLTYDEIFEA